MSLKAQRLRSRHEAIVTAARDLFVERGYAATSLADIVERSGGSLSTLYKLFGGKEGLLIAALESEPDSFSQEIARMVDSGDDPAKVLRALSLVLHKQMTSPKWIALLRVIISESLRNPEFARRLDQGARVQVHEQMASLFRRWLDEGRIPADEDPAELAEMFLGMIVHDFQLRVIIHLADNELTPERVLRRVDRFIRFIELKG